MNAINTLEVSALQLSQVDVLGSLLAQISELTKEADAIKDGLKDAATAGGDKVVEGALFKATAIEANRSVVDYKKLCADLGGSQEVTIKKSKWNGSFLGSVNEIFN